MLKLTVFLAVIVAASAASIANEDIVRRLLRVLEEENLQRRSINAFGYDAGKEKIRIGLMICVKGDRGPECPGRKGHIVIIHDENDNVVYEKYLRTYSIDGQGEAKAPTMSIDASFARRQVKYSVSSCEVMKKDNALESCNTFKFTGGKSTPFSPMGQKKTSDDAKDDMEGSKTLSQNNLG